MDRRQFRNYAMLGVGVVTVIIILRRLTAPKLEEDKALPAPEKTQLGVDLFTTDYNASQAASFRAALPPLAQQYAGLFVSAGREYGVSPLILAGLMATETGFGTGCKDKMCRGFAGDDYGLMQINSKAHPEFFASKVNGRPAYEDPQASVNYGAKVLRDALRFFDKPNKSGQYEVSTRYGAKFSCLPGKKPDPRPVTGMQRLIAGIAAYNAGAGAAIQAMACGLSADAATYNRGYAKKVIGYAEQFLANMKAT